MAKRIPKYNYLPAKELPPYQLFKRWQLATRTKSMEKFGTMSKAKLLADIKKWRPELLQPKARWHKKKRI